MSNSVLTQISTWASLGSAIFAMATVIIAFMALNQWQKQYEENKFLRFVDAIIEYNNCLIRAPKRMAEDTNNEHRKALTVAANELQMRWLICLNTKRGMKNRELIEAMQVITNKHFDFLAGKIPKLELTIGSIVTIALHTN